MITQEQEKWLAHLSNNDTIRIIPFDPTSNEKFEIIKNKIKAELGNTISVEHHGATSLGISGQDEIDVYVRKCSYAVVLNVDGKILALRKPNGTVHLPGGGIDEGEYSQTAAVRETLEEADCEITDLKLIGSANQYYKKTKRGPMNKLGVFYSARLVRAGVGGVEPDHEVWWLTPTEFITEHSTEFQKWAVEKMLQ